jgi:hypothetical protein
MIPSVIGTEALGDSILFTCGQKVKPTSRRQAKIDGGQSKIDAAGRQLPTEQVELGMVRAVDGESPPETVKILRIEEADGW